MRVLRLMLVVILGATLANSEELQRLSTKKLPSEVRFATVMSIARDSTGTLYVVDATNHRVVVLSLEGKFLRQIGGEGQGPDDLMHPTSVAVDDGETVAVLDSGNNRVQFFSPVGKGRGGFPLPVPKVRADSIALGAHGTILLNRPSSGKLVSVYSREGKALKAFGDLLPSSVVYPGKPSDQFPQRLLNIARLANDSDGSVWVVFHFMPIVQRYSSTGDLKWQIRLSGPAVEEGIKTFWGEPGARPFRTGLGIEGHMLASIVTGATVTSRGNLALTLALPHILAVDRVGNQIRYLAYGDATNRFTPARALAEYNGILIFGEIPSLSRTDGEDRFLTANF